MKQISSHLPADLNLLRVQSVPIKFHAIQAVKKKQYAYLAYVSQCECQHSDAARIAWHVRQPVDLQAMRATASLFIGLHNFRAFTSSNSEKDCKRTVTAVHITNEGNSVTVPFLGVVSSCCQQTTENAEGHFVRFRVEGLGFLKHQVRRMVGVLLQVGLGNLQQPDVAAAIATPDSAVWYGENSRLGVRQIKAPPQGLWLERIVCHGESEDEDGATAEACPLEDEGAYNFGGAKRMRHTTDLEGSDHTSITNRIDQRHHVLHDENVIENP